MRLAFKGSPPTLTFHQIRASRSVKADGSVVFSNLFDRGDGIIISSSIDRPAGVSHDDMDRIVISALRSANLKTDFTEEDFLSVVSQLLKLRLNRRLEKYIVFSHITLKGKSPSKFYKLNNSIVAFPSNNNSLLKKISNSHHKLVNKHSRTFSSPEIKVPYRPIVAYVQARNVDEALDTGRDAFDDVRGLMNLFENSKTQYRRSYGKYYPINKAKLLPIITVHLPDGSSAVDQIWFDRAWETPFSALDPHQDIDGFTENFNKWILKIRKRHGLSEIAQVALRHYVRSIDYSDWRQSFLGLWTTIEYLSNIRNADYDRLVKRASKIFYEHGEQRELLQHLRVRRNHLIHEASDAPVSETIVYQAKNVVEPFIRFVLANRLDLRDKQELSDFLDLPTDRDSLKRRIALAEKGLKYLRA